MVRTFKFDVQQLQICRSIHEKLYCQYMLWIFFLKSRQVIQSKHFFSDRTLNPSLVTQNPTAQTRLKHKFRQKSNQVPKIPKKPKDADCNPWENCKCQRNQRTSTRRSTCYWIRWRKCGGKSVLLRETLKIALAARYEWTIERRRRRRLQLRLRHKKKRETIASKPNERFTRGPPISFVRLRSSILP